MCCSRWCRFSRKTTVLAGSTEPISCDLYWHLDYFLVCLVHILERGFVLECPKNRERVSLSQGVFDHLCLLTVLVTVGPVVVKQVCVPRACGFGVAVTGYMAKL